MRSWFGTGSATRLTFIEPFCGSAAVLLARPHVPRVETVNDAACLLPNFTRASSPEHGDPGAVADSLLETINDADPHIANVWRSLQQAPAETAEWADFPVDESYLHAVHRWLVLGDEAAEFRRRMRTEPDYFDAKRAGRWLYGCCCWIGGGWCTEPGMERHGGATPTLAGSNGTGQGVHASRDVDHKRPLVAAPESAHGRGVYGEAQDVPHEKRPRVHRANGSETDGTLPGVHGRPQLADAYSLGRGVHGGPALPAKRVLLGHEDNQGVHAQSDGGPLRHGAHAHVQDFAGGTCAARRLWLLDWFSRLRDRLRNVRVCCGDFLRVCDSESVTTRLGLTGIFFDPPYRTKLADGTQNRADSLYATDGKGEDAVDRVIAYCLERGGNPKMRIAACGYEGEGYEVLLERGWTVVEWRSQGGYSNANKSGNKNRARERIFFSPHCQRDRTLFD